MSSGQLIGFTLVALVLIVVPGPGVLFIVGRALSHGRRTAVATATGHAAGNYVVAACVAFGLGALLQRSAEVFTAVKLAGAAYLAYLGVRMLISAIMSGDAPAETAETAETVPPRPGGAAFRQGLVTNLLNPKIALLFLTLLPQFVADGEPRLRTTAVLAAVFLGLAVLWWRTFSLAIGPISRVLRGRRSRRLLDAVAGSALIAISVRVALEGGR